MCLEVTVEMATRRPGREPAIVSEDRRTTVRGKLTHHVGGDASYTVRRNRTAEIGRDDDLKVGRNLARAVAGAASETVGGNRATATGGDETATVGGNRSTAIGKDDRLSVGKMLLIEAGDELTIKCGAASITLKKDGTVTIRGKDIVIDGSGDATIKAAKNIVLKGQKILEN
jgi:type VI secretion system secreted protein VgrG